MRTRLQFSSNLLRAVRLKPDLQSNHNTNYCRSTRLSASINSNIFCRTSGSRCKRLPAAVYCPPLHVTPPLPRLPLNPSFPPQIPQITHVQQHGKSYITGFTRDCLNKSVQVCVKACVIIRMCVCVCTRT